MKVIVTHDQFGKIRSVAVPGRKLPFGEMHRRPADGEFVAVVDAPDPSADKDLPAAIKKISVEFRVAPVSSRLIHKKPADKTRESR